MKNKGGRPTAYRREYAEQARKLCLLGATDAKLAEFFEVSLATIKNWKHDFPEFLASLKKGKDIADAEVAHSLFKRATGIKCKEKKLKSDGSIETLERELPPDPTAIIFWLKNRQPEKWRDKQKEDTSQDSKSVYVHNSLHIPGSIDVD